MTIMGPSQPDQPVRELRFPGRADAYPGAEPGGCQFGALQCVNPPEVEVQLPATKVVRALCRDHVGWFMVGATTEERVARVLVRRLAGLEEQSRSA